MMNHTIMIPSQHKLAEKLTILNDRGIGMLTRISNIKKACSDKDPNSKPSFLLEKSLDNTFKQIAKKFPNFEKGSSSQFQSLVPFKTEILKSLSLYYHTFVDLLDFKDHVSDLLTTIGACQLQFDIMLNFDLTKNYLDLIATYVSLLILLSRVDDRKTVLGLFTIAHEMVNGQADASFPRLGQMIIDYENPMKKLIDDFTPYTKLVFESLLSLHTKFKAKNLNADDLRRKLVLNLTSQANTLSEPPYTDAINCDYLSFDQIERWIVFLSPLCMNNMNNQDCLEMFRNVLLNSHVHCLYRDDFIQTHAFLIQCLESSKNHLYNKKLFEIVKETQSQCYQTIVYDKLILFKVNVYHYDRRKFLRMALRELILLFSDQPGLLGPKALYVFMGLSMARDEIHWLLRHQSFYNQSAKIKSAKSKEKNEWKDKYLPELLFLVEELRSLVRKYSHVIQRYYVEYLNGADSGCLSQILQQIGGSLHDDESVLLQSFSSTISAISVKQIENHESINFKPLRLDWFRFQSYTSVTKNASFSLMKAVAKIMNTISFHTKLVDNLEELLIETSDLSIFCFYPSLFFDAFSICGDYPTELNYTIAFPQICTHFINCTHELCPEERQFIGRKSIDIASKVLEEMARETKAMIFQACNLYAEMNSKLQQNQCLPFINEHIMKKQKSKDKKSKQQQSLPKPGYESVQSNREDRNDTLDHHVAIAKWCFALNYCSSINVWEYTFYPREYLYLQLDAQFNKVLIEKCVYEINEKAESRVVLRKPSEMLNIIHSYTFMLLSIENYAHIDMTKAFNNVLVQQTNNLDQLGHKTLTNHYNELYVNQLLKKMTNPLDLTTYVVYSPSQKCFIQIKGEQLRYSPEEYMNYNELLALSEICGVLGVKYIIENVNEIIKERVTKTKEIVVQNKDILNSLRISFDRPELMKELYRRLDNLKEANLKQYKKNEVLTAEMKLIQDIDSAIQHILAIGVLLAFKNLLSEALNEVLDRRLPFLMNSVQDISKAYDLKGNVQKDINDLLYSCGYSSQIDIGLYETLKPKQNTIDGESNLLMVLLAVTLPRLTRYDSSLYRPDLQAHCNNAHCLAITVNTLATCFFFDLNSENQENLQKVLTEFLALSSSALLKLVNDGNETAISSYSASSSSGLLPGLSLTPKELQYRDSIYIVLDQIIQASPYLTYDVLESCFPYSLIRSSYRHILKLHPMAYPNNNLSANMMNSNMNLLANQQV